MSDCDTCGGDEELCLQVSRNQYGWTRLWIRTKHCNVDKTGAPHRHNLVPCKCQEKDDV